MARVSKREPPPDASQTALLRWAAEVLAVSDALRLALGAKRTD
jgi:hypothetical protein